MLQLQAKEFQEDASLGTSTQTWTSVTFGAPVTDPWSQ